jgi:hypothetical protein
LLALAQFTPEVTQLQPHADSSPEAIAQQHAKQCTAYETEQYPETNRSWGEIQAKPKAYWGGISQGENESSQDKQHEEQKLEESGETLHHTISVPGTHWTDSQSDILLKQGTHAASKGNNRYGLLGVLLETGLMPCRNQ